MSKPGAIIPLPAVSIRRNADGAVSTFHWDGEIHVYLWEFGNFSCDCNREILFERGMGLENREMHDYGCSQGAYSIVSLIDERGRQVYSEVA